MLNVITIYIHTIINNNTFLKLKMRICETNFF